MAMRTQTQMFTGMAGAIDCAIDWPDDEPRGWALVLHPHSLQGGSRENKVVTTLARACVQEGLVAVRPNFRGVGGSQGQFDQARGETEDMLALVQAVRLEYPQLAAGPWVLAGFSFGTAVAACLHARLAEAGQPTADAVLLAGIAVHRYPPRDGQAAQTTQGAQAAQAEQGAQEPQHARLPDDALLMHGEQDEVVPLAEVFDWARPLGLPVVVVPGSGHFFHGKLLALKQLALARLKLLRVSD